MVTRDIVFNSCNDACNTITTDRRVEGAPVYRCTGCDSEWIELDERTTPGVPDPEPAAPVPAEAPTAAPPAPEPATAAVAEAPADSVAPVQLPPGAVVPQLMQTVLDARDIRQLAEFYRAFLDLRYRPGHAPPFHGADDAEWLVLTHPDGTSALAFRADDQHVAPTWPKKGVPPQVHIDLSVPDLPSLNAACQRAVSLGARILADRATHSDDSLVILADPAGHPFCIVVA